MFSRSIEGITKKSGLPEQLCKTMLVLGWRYVETPNKPDRWEAYGLNTRLPVEIKQQLIRAGWTFYKEPTIRWVRPYSMVGMANVG